MEIEIIKAKEQFNDSSKKGKNNKLRVAAYCRVSTDDPDQIKSYDSMVKHYTDLIKSSKDWIFAGVYADRAITGTKVDKREEFQKMINDCLNGNIDMVIAKSLPRFARNTLDTLKYVRLLKEKNVAVYFEVEKINTLKDGEFLMTILSSVAQQEVENTSAYVKKGLKMKMQRGEMVGFHACMGYDYDSINKKLVINEEGAEVVKYIFERYASGAGGTIIARELNERGILTLHGNSWSSSAVLEILNNEKYIGDVLMGKTFTIDPISKRRLVNLGEEDQYYIHNHHEPIISKELFDKAQEIRNRRNGKRNSATPGAREKFSRQYAFSCLLKCGFCGSTLSRRNWHSGTQHSKIIWQCVAATKNGKKNCIHSKGIPESVIEKAFVESYKMLHDDNKDILDRFLHTVHKTLDADQNVNNIKTLLAKQKNIERKRNTLLEKYLDDSIDKELYITTDQKLFLQLKKLSEQIHEMDLERQNKDILDKRLQDFRRILSKSEYLSEFDRNVFESIVEKVIIGGYDDDGKIDPYKITFIYKNGFDNTIYDAKTHYGEPKKKPGPKNKKHLDGESSLKDTCSNDNTNLGVTCQNSDIDTCGDRMFTTSNREEEFVEILCFKHFSRFWRFDSITKKGRKKEVIDSVDVSVVLHIV